MASGFGTCSMTPRPDSQSRLMRHALQIIAERKTQVGPVAVTFTIGRIQSRSALSAADNQGGGLCVSVLSHDLGDSQ